MTTFPDIGRTGQKCRPSVSDSLSEKWGEAWCSWLALLVFCQGWARCGFRRFLTRELYPGTGPKKVPAQVDLGASGRGLLCCRAKGFSLVEWSQCLCHWLPSCRKRNTWVILAQLCLLGYILLTSVLSFGHRNDMTSRQSIPFKQFKLVKWCNAMIWNWHV